MIKAQICVKSENTDDEDVLKFRASDSSPDRDGDIIKASGWVLDNYKKNPVFLWGHNSSTLPLGKAIDVSVGYNELVLDIKFAKKGADYDEWPTTMPSPTTVKALYKSEFLNATSVGFLPIEWKRIEDPAERQRLGLGPWGLLYEKQELLELSAVTVPSNPNALRLAVAAGVLTEKEFGSFKSQEQLVIEMLEEVKQGLTMLGKQFDPKQFASMLKETTVVSASVAPALEPVQVVTPEPRALLGEFQKLWCAMGKDEALDALAKLF